MAHRSTFRCKMEYTSGTENTCRNL